MADGAQLEPGEHGASRRPLLRVFAYARPLAPQVALVLVITLAAGITDVSRAYLFKPFLDGVALPQAAATEPMGLPEALGGAAQAAEEAAPGAGPAELDRRVRENALRLALVALLLMLGLPLLRFARGYGEAWILGRTRVDMTRDIGAKLLALPLRFHRSTPLGDVYTRAIQDADRAHGSLSILFADILERGATLLAGLGFLFVISWQLTLVMLLAAPGVTLVALLFGRRIRDSARVRQEQFSEVNQRLLDILSGIKVIKVFRAEATELGAFRREAWRLFRRSLKVSKNRLLARGLVDLLNQTLTVAALVLGGWMLLGGFGGLTIGDLTAFFAISLQAVRPLRRLAQAWTQLADASPAAERFFRVLDEPVPLQDAPGAIDLPPISRSVAMRDVCFAYDSEPCLREISFEARVGEVVAIVGPTGAGKTTLVDLLTRLHDPDRGSVEIDGIDLRRLRRSSLLEQMAVVTQEPFLFDTTLRENLLYGRPDASEEELLAAARAAHVDEFARELPEGYDTPVGSLGLRLSGGERQRVTLARAILRDPAILILDEATSALDNRSEKAVQEAVEALLGDGRTVFVVAHRLSTVRRADRILVLERGRLVQQGTHAELLAQPGLYRELAEISS